MSYNFKNAIIRKPNKSIQNGLSSKNLHPQYEIIVEEHTNYVKAINDAGLKINLLSCAHPFPYIYTYAVHHIFCTISHKK